MTVERVNAGQKVFGLTAVQEALALWGASFLTIILTFILWRSQAKLAATVSFLYFPYVFMRRRNEDYRDYGVSFRAWKRDLAWALGACALVFPLYFLGFWGFLHFIPRIPVGLVRVMTPLQAYSGFHARLPPQFAKWVVDQLFVVALPEEFFYRGYLLTRLRDAWPGGRRLFGVRLGPAFFLTAVLFALGHLAIFQAWRLAVFFPALLFAFLREKTGTVMGCTLVHAACNLFEMFLEVSFTPLWVPR